MKIKTKQLKEITLGVLKPKVLASYYLYGQLRRTPATAPVTQAVRRATEDAQTAAAHGRRREKKKWHCCLLLHVLLLLLLDVGSHRLLLEVAVAREGKKKKHQRLTDRSRGRRSSSSFRWVAESGATAGLWPAEAGDGQRRETEGDEKKEKKKKNCLWKEEIEGKITLWSPVLSFTFC